MTHSEVSSCCKNSCCVCEVFFFFSCLVGSQRSLTWADSQMSVVWLCFWTLRGRIEFFLSHFTLLQLLRLQRLKHIFLCPVLKCFCKIHLLANPLPNAQALHLKRSLKTRFRTVFWQLHKPPTIKNKNLLLTWRRSMRPVRACSHVRFTAYRWALTTLVSWSSSGTMAAVRQPCRNMRSCNNRQKDEFALAMAAQSVNMNQFIREKIVNISTKNTKQNLFFNNKIKKFEGAYF